MAKCKRCHRPLNAAAIMVYGSAGPCPTCLRTMHKEVVTARKR